MDYDELIKQGKVVVTGMVGMDIPRDQYYKKELDFKLSLSYGPGRYDPAYEEGGHDYPYGYVRWTEQRNMRAFLDLVAEGKVTPSRLITHRFDFENALDAYELIAGETNEPYLGIVLEYRRAQSAERIGLEEEDEKVRKLEGQRTVRLSGAEHGTGPLLTPHSSSLTPVVGFIGAGNFAKGVLLPQLRKLGGVRLKGICTATGMNAAVIGKKEGFEFATTDYRQILEDPDINTVFIATRHDTHAQFVCEALMAGKHVFVEKPLCLTEEELEEIRGRWSEVSGQWSGSQLQASDFRSPTSDYRQLMVGFNRRFSPHVRKMKELLDTLREPKSMIMTVNAGMIPPEHWTQDPEVGGGRIIGEACHFIDLLRFLASAEITDSHITRMKAESGDTATVQLGFKDGSIGTIHYFANGSKIFPKERLEVFDRTEDFAVG